MPKPNGSSDGVPSTRAGVMASARRSPSARNPRVAVAAAAALLLVAALVALLSGGGKQRLPLPGVARPARAGDPFGYIPSRESQFVARASAGNAHVLFAKSPGGALATAARVARFRGLVDAATRRSTVSPDVLEAIVFLESAGRPDAVAG